MKSGWDGYPNIGEANERDRRTTRVSVLPQVDVPGSDPVENALDVAHSLSSVASRQETVQTRMNMMRDVPKLMASLTTTI